MSFQKNEDPKVNVDSMMQNLFAKIYRFTKEESGRLTVVIDDVDETDWNVNLKISGLLIGDYQYGETHQLLPGKYSVEIESECYESKTKVVEIDRKKDKQLTFSLKRKEDAIEKNVFLKKITAVQNSTNLS